MPYCAAFALLGSVPFVLGEMVSVQMPHQHSILGGKATHYVSLSLAVIQYSTGERTRQSREDDVTISTTRPEFLFRFFKYYSKEYQK